MQHGQAKLAPTGARAICDALRDQIRSGVYQPGSKLPSSRALAAELGVSRTTVSSAYEQLVAEGYIAVRQGARPTVSKPTIGDTQLDDTKHCDRPVRLSAFGQRILANSRWPDTAPKRLEVDFRYGPLCPDDFPLLAWKRALGSVTSRTPERLSYHDPRGSIRLRTALQGYLWRARTLRCDVDQIIVINGSQQGLDICARVLLDEGDGYLMEDPGYWMARHVFASVGGKPLPMPVDNDGMQVAAGAEKNARLAYVTPSHQFPTGCVMSFPRRRALLDWARSGQGYIVEDDYDSEYRYDVGPVPPIFQLDEQGSVIYLGTVSKTLSPTLRIGYMVVPRQMMSVFTRAKQLIDRHTSLSEQEALAEMIESGAYERHVRKARRLNRARRERLLTNLENYFGDDVSVVGAAAGLHLVAWFHHLTSNDAKQVVEAARKAGVGVYPISELYESPEAHAGLDRLGLVMGYASLRHSQIDKGIRRLHEAISKLPSSSPIGADRCQS